MDTLFQDLRYALRMMRKYRASTALAVLTLAIGIGANTAIFSVADLLLFRPVSFEGLDRLVMVLETNPRNLSGWNDVSPANFLDWRRQARSFESLSAYNWKAANLTGQGASAVAWR